jgi:hypothetical protein
MQHFVLFHFETLEDEGSIFLGNLNNRLYSDTTAYPRRSIRPHSHENLETRIICYIFKSNGNYTLKDLGRSCLDDKPFIILIKNV